MKRETRRSRSYSSDRGKARTRKSRFARAFRALFTFTLIACVLFCIGAFVAKASKPYLISYGESKEISDIKNQIADARAENMAIKKDIKYLSTPEGKEAEARKLGWVKEGEVALVIEPHESENKDGQSLNPPVKESFWSSAGRRILGLFARPDSTR